jgi:hypothetical protein
MTRLPLLAPALFLALLLPAPVAQANNPIQPGDIVFTNLGQCTLDFVFDGAGGETYFGIAGHCVSLNSDVSTTGHNGFGTVVYDDDFSADFALIRVKTAHVPSVAAAVKGHPGMPTGVVQPGNASTGDLLLFSGYGLLFGSTQLTQEERVGVLYSTGEVGYCATGPALFGDSGGPVLHANSSKALGIVNRLGCVGTVSGTLVSYAIQRATSQGFPISLRAA